MFFPYLQKQIKGNQIKSPTTSIPERKGANGRISVAFSQMACPIRILVSCQCIGTFLLEIQYAGVGVFVYINLIPILFDLNTSSSYPCSSRCILRWWMCKCVPITLTVCMCACALCYMLLT